MHRHPEALHSSKMEVRLQWIAIVCMAIGLISSIYYQALTLKSERIESEINAYLHLNDRYYNLLFTLINNDPEIFRRTDSESILKNKYIMYELFELFATVDLLESHFDELGEEVTPGWKRRMEFIFSKPSVRHVWQNHLSYAGKIYNAQFIEHVTKVIASSSDASPLNEPLTAK